MPAAPPAAKIAACRRPALPLPDPLRALRDEIDTLDRAIVQALARRQAVVAEVAALKDGAGRRVRDLGREEDHLRRLLGAATAAGVDEGLVKRLYHEIFEHSRRTQEEVLSGVDPAEAPVRRRDVAYQGSPQSYAHLAGERFFATKPGRTTFRPLPTFEAVLASVAEGSASYGLLPVENTTAGSINRAYNLLTESELFVVGEELQRIELCLLAKEPLARQRVERVFAHASALAQCSKLLASMGACRVESYTDTALALERLRRARGACAVIAGEHLAGPHGLAVIERHVANQRENVTRYLVVAAEPARYDPRVPCKTSVVFATGHREGALVACLEILSERGLSMTKLESRPRPHTPWEYAFYLDFLGNRDEPAVADALAAMEERTRSLRVLGSYPARNTEANRPAEPAAKL